MKLWRHITGVYYSRWWFYPMLAIANLLRSKSLVVFAIRYGVWVNFK